MHTEHQATALWCPMVRAANGKQATNCTVNVQPLMKDYAAQPLDEHTMDGSCIASKCAMWRWNQPASRLQSATRTGFCGLAGSAGTY